MSIKLEDLRGESVKYQFLNEEWRPAFIINIYPDGLADLCVLVAGASGSYYAANVPYGTKQGMWCFRKIPEGIAEVLSRLTPEQMKTLGVEEEGELFADEAKEPTPVSAKSADTEPVRKSGTKTSRPR